jgi:hypothetical protein
MAAECGATVWSGLAHHAGSAREGGTHRHNYVCGNGRWLGFATDAYNDVGSASFQIKVDNTVPAGPSISGPLGWQRGTIALTSSATTAGPSGIQGQTCTVGSGPASWYPGASAQISVSGNGTQPVSCYAVTNAGVTGPSSVFDALPDNTAPNGYFAPRDPSNPTQVVVDVADSMSGVAGGQLEIQTASDWQNLATSYDANTGQLTATIPDNGSIPDGDHQLRALVWDAVDNVASITTDATTTPEVVALPIRIVTQLRVGRSRALITRCTIKHIRLRHRKEIRHQRAAARLVRRCTQVAVPRTRGSLQLKAGQGATVSGLLQTTDGQPITDAQVTVSQQAPGWTKQSEGTLATNSQGRFAYRIRRGPSRTMTFSFPGTSTLRASGGATRVRVKGKAEIKVSRHARAGRTLQISGRVIGGFIPPDGVLVQLQYRVKDVPVGWAPFENPIHTSKSGHWKLTFPLAREAAGYTYVFRALISSQTDWPYLSTTTNQVARHVTG